MSWADTKCPCGGIKERETMLCGECLETFAATTELAAVNNPLISFSGRRGCAIRLLSMARKRKKRPAWGYGVEATV